MAVKELAFESEARAGLLSGVEKLAAAVKPTLGPRGRNAVIDKSWGGPTVTKDGVTVAEEIDLVDKNENLGAKLVKEAASKTSKVAGDGTTTATILTEALFKEAYKNLAAGADAMALNRGMQKAAEVVTKKLESLAKPIDITKANDIINIASVGGMRCVPAMPAYCTSKAALIMLTQQAALDYGPQNIRCNAVCPGGIKTAMLEKEFGQFGKMLGMDHESYFDIISAALPLQRFGQPSEITGICTYLASDDASFTTGAAMLVDAGSSIVDVVGASIMASLKSGGVI